MVVWRQWLLKISPFPSISAIPASKANGRLVHACTVTELTGTRSTTISIGLAAIAFPRIRLTRVAVSSGSVAVGSKSGESPIMRNRRGVEFVDSHSDNCLLQPWGLCPRNQAHVFTSSILT